MPPLIPSASSANLQRSSSLTTSSLHIDAISAQQSNTVMSAGSSEPWLNMNATADVAGPLIPSRKCLLDCDKWMLRPVTFVKHSTVRLCICSTLNALATIMSAARPSFTHAKNVLSLSRQVGQSHQSVKGAVSVQAAGRLFEPRCMDHWPVQRPLVCVEPGDWVGLHKMCTIGKNRNRGYPLKDLQQRRESENIFYIVHSHCSCGTVHSHCEFGSCTAKNAALNAGAEQATDCSQIMPDVSLSSCPASSCQT